ncbi:S26 family signal peptidase [Micromonospora echinospora]|uniref:S26 family signal peptidase n=1 Tax=Micromonospora echinospora TaxID=1877 RepID=UPI00379E604C
MGTTLALVTAGVGLLAALLAVLRRRLFMVVVSGRSMVPTYQEGDRLLARRRRSRALPVGSVVVLAGQHGHGPGHHVPVTVGSRVMTLRTSRYLVKRLAAGPGDAVPPECATAFGDDAPAVVPPGKVVVLGDNTANSLDSRALGFLDEQQIIGTVIRRMTAGSPTPPAPREPDLRKTPRP